MLLVRDVGSITHEPTGRHEGLIVVDRGHSVRTRSPSGAAPSDGSPPVIDATCRAADGRDFKETPRRKPVSDHPG
jgi:hypothetical protein